MRRTLFVFPRETLGFAQAGASNRVADSERRRLSATSKAAGLYRDGARWLSEASKSVLAVLSDRREATASELRDEIPLLEGSVAYGWPGRAGVGRSSRSDCVVRGRAHRAGVQRRRVDHFTPRWASARSWLGDEIAPPEAEGSQLFDSSGNAGPTVWWDGRIVGGWRQRDTGEVDLQMLEDVGTEGLRAVGHEVVRLTEWFGGTRVLPRFPSPLSNPGAGTGS